MSFSFVKAHFSVKRNLRLNSALGFAEPDRLLMVRTCRLVLPVIVDAAMRGLVGSISIGPLLRLTALGKTIFWDVYCLIEPVFINCTNPAQRARVESQPRIDSTWGI
jgi:hypothetical protein